MVLAVISGLLAGLIRAKLGKRKLQSVCLRAEWIVVAAVIPQFIVFSNPITSPLFSDLVVRLTLVLTLWMLVFFVGVNFSQPFFWIIGVGLLANMAVIILNGGLMPVRPELLDAWNATLGNLDWTTGTRFGYSKDIVLPLYQTKLWFLSDYFSFQTCFPIKFAFSVGDVLISVGLFCFLFSLGKGKTSIGGENVQL